MFAVFNPSTKPPPGGFCISVFLIVKKNDSVLVGKISDSETWKERWGLDVGHPERWREKWQIPATFLKIGEHPDDGVRRVWVEQLGLSDPSFSLPKILVSSGPSSVRPGTVHSDLFFVYEKEYDNGIVQLPHFSGLHFESMSELKKLQFGRGHDEVLALCGYPF
jgi:ADP-ribose pyrophosphatase YjhB (NUDIX family)